MPPYEEQRRSIRILQAIFHLITVLSVVAGTTYVRVQLDSLSLSLSLGIPQETRQLS
jgi:hypothetical protein